MAEIELIGICKSFDGVPVLKDVSASFAAGEIHALMGANGAGKSTLMNILAGVKPADSGSIRLFGEERKIRSVRDAEDCGIVMIHQELNLMPDLTAAQNIFIGREPMRGPVIDDKQMNRDAKVLFEKVSLDADPSIPVRRLSVGKRQLLEIAKALSKKSRVLILDEPTAALSAAETEELFSVMRELRQQGICMIYISHRMDEIFRISDRITVLRDGVYVGTVEAKDTNKDELVQMMVGRTVRTYVKEENPALQNAPTVLEVRKLQCAATGVREVSFTLRRGEILGFAGLVGAGRSEAMRAMCAIDRKDRAKVFLHGKRMHFRSPADAVRRGICYLSEDRRRDGMLLHRSVSENTVISSLRRFVRYGQIDTAAADEAAAKICETVFTKYASLHQPIESLSGGNQQKVILARWLLADMDIFIFDEPTRGIDVGAKDEIYSAIEALAAAGKSVIVVSSESAELRRLCDRILVMCEGRITGELTARSADDETLLHYATMRGERKKS